MNYFMICIPAHTLPSHGVRIQHFRWFLLGQRPPAGRPRIYGTNSSEHDFYPKVSVRDETGVKRRQIFVEVVSDLRMCTVAGTFV